MQQNNNNSKKDQLSDLIDSPKDREKLKEEIIELNLPSVSDEPCRSSHGWR